MNHKKTKKKEEWGERNTEKIICDNKFFSVPGDTIKCFICIILSILSNMIRNWFADPGILIQLSDWVQITS